MMMRVSLIRIRSISSDKPLETEIPHLLSSFNFNSSSISQRVKGFPRALWQHPYLTYIALQEKVSYPRSLLKEFELHFLRGQANLLRVALQDDPKLSVALDSDRRTPLQNAISTLPPSVSTVTAILDLLPQLEEKEKEQALENADEVGGTALLSAASAGNLEILTVLVGAGAKVTTANNKGLTPLHYAASKGHVSVGRLLIEKGADINTRDKANQIALHRAASVGAVPFIRLILSSTSPSRPSAPRLNAQDRNGNTPLHLAIESGHAEAAVVLIEGGADRERCDQDGVRPEEIEGVGGQAAKKVREHSE